MKKTLLAFVFGLLVMGVNAQTGIQNNNLVPNGGGSACTSWGQPSPTTGWTNFNTVFGGAPCNDGTGCPFNQIITFEVWQGEAYAMNNVIAGGSYTFSMCNGPGAGSWTPDFTIIAPGGAVDAFGTGDGDGCSITWTASTSGAYLIVINQLGNCGFVGTTNNGFPAITCNGTPSCTPQGECSAGELASSTPQFICPGENALFATDGNESIPLAPGGYAIIFTPTTGTGGVDDVLILFGVSLPFSFNSDLNGVLSFNDLDPLSGEWSLQGVAYENVADIEGSICSETSQSLLVTFLSSNNPLCGGSTDCDAGVIADTSPQFICPGDFAIYETDGSEIIPALPGGYAIIFTPTTGTGGVDDVLLLYQITLPYTFDSDLNGLLSFFSLPPLAGEWLISGFAYTDEADLEGTICSETSESFLVTFLGSNDPLCGGSGQDCLSWVSPSPTTGWSDFNILPLTGAPVPVAGVCPFVEITGFEVWKSEAYAMDNVVVETCYTFSHCNGPGAGSWVPYYAIIAPSGAVDYQGLGDGDGCSVTWIASESGTYLIVINEDGNCGVAASINNGYPAITCNGSGCLTVDVAENNAANFSIFPNPNKGQFAISSLGQNGTAQVDVLEISGKLIQSQQVNFTANSVFDVNIGNNVGGIYFVRITMNNEVKVHKVVVQ